MPLAQPVHVTPPAWKAIRDEVIAPAAAKTGPRAPGLARLAAAWDEAQPTAGRVRVWLDADLAAALADLLDERPELRGLLSGESP